jgi:cytosine/adenosine deaminase-related metal-dependent hydrolase
VEDAVVLGQDGRITAVGPYAKLRGQIQADLQDLGDAVLCPGLINAHTHLGLSHIPARELVLGQGFAAWVASLVPHLIGPTAKSLDRPSLDAALEQLQACGTAFVADVAGRGAALVAEGLDAAGLDYWLCLEFFGHETSGPPNAWPLHGQDLPGHVWNKVAAGGHALYSTAPDVLRHAKTWSRTRQRPFSLHLAESSEELELLASGAGDLAAFYRAAGVLPEGFAPPGVSPVAYAERLGLLDNTTLAVHAVHVDAADIATLARAGTSV